MENNRDLEIKRKEALALIKEWVKLETENIRTDSKYNQDSKEKDINSETV
ncbi:hypothetical protein [Psychrobacillus sp. L4]